MSTPNQPAELWYPEVVELMVTERINILQAVARLQIDLPDIDAHAHSRRKSFRSLYDIALRAYFAAKGAPSETDKTVLVGSILDDAAKLREMGKPKEASEATEKAAKVLGLIGTETNVNLFGEISGSELQKKIEEVRRKREAQSAVN